MEFKGFDKETMRKFFQFILEDKPVYIKTHRMWLQKTSYTRNIGHTGKQRIENFTIDQCAEEDAAFQNSMALLYLKTFYRKTPADFNTDLYKTECKKFNEKLNSMPNQAQIRKKIEECLSKNSVNYVAKELPQELFYENLPHVNLSMDNPDNTSIFINRDIRDHARFYINPSQEDYRHFMEFVVEKASKQELQLKAKTRLTGNGALVQFNPVHYRRRLPSNTGNFE